MKFLLALLVALTLTVAWHSSVVAGVGAKAPQSVLAADDEKKKGDADEEPECD